MRPFGQTTCFGRRRAAEPAGVLAAGLGIAVGALALSATAQPEASPHLGEPQESGRARRLAEPSPVVQHASQQAASKGDATPDAARPDYAKLEIKGHGHRQDSFVLAVQAAARLFGRETDYEMLTCLAGNAFAPFRNLDEDCPVVYPPNMWAVSPGEVTLRSPEVERVMVRQAVDYIRGRGLFQASKPVVYGLAAMDAWITHMETVKGYCAPCFGRGQDSWHDAMENAERFLRGAQIAARKLRAAGPQFEAAAKHYDRIAELLTPAARGKGEVHYAAFIGDLDKQKAHAETVLKPVRAELLAAAVAMETAVGLSAAGPASGPVEAAQQRQAEAEDAQRGATP